MLSALQLSAVQYFTGSRGGGRGGDTGQGKAMAMATSGHNRAVGIVLKCSVQVCVYFPSFKLSLVTTALVAEELGGLVRSWGAGGWSHAVKNPGGVYF